MVRFFRPLVFTALLLAVQYPLWFGEGGWLRVWELDTQLKARQKANEALTQRNEVLEAEVLDLAEGHIAIEERARYDLGMIGADEVFVQINHPQPGRPERDTATGDVQTARVDESFPR